jgi:hypothetical protein
MNELARMDNNSSEINLLINEFEKTIAQVIQVTSLTDLAVLWIQDVYPGSEFCPSQNRIKEFKYFNPKKCC